MGGKSTNNTTNSINLGGAIPPGKTRNFNMDFDIWIKICDFHLILNPDEIKLIFIKNGLFHYLINWNKSERSSSAEITVTENSDPIPF